MTPERWQKIESVFQTAVELPPKDRSEYVQVACAGDLGLRNEVEKLLRSFDSAEDFIESPVWTDSMMLNSSAKRIFPTPLRTILSKRRPPIFRASN
jgi:hypothetical protein